MRIDRRVEESVAVVRAFGVRGDAKVKDGDPMRGFPLEKLDALEKLGASSDGVDPGEITLDEFKAGLS